MRSDPWAPFRAARLARQQEAYDAAVAAETWAAQQQAELEDRLKGEKGDKGDKGDRGDKGDPGAPGIDGRDGKDGADGTDGRDGTNGSDGTNGLDGRDGVGLPGEPGARGPRGLPGPSVVRSSFRLGTGNRIEAVVEYLSDGTERTFNVQRDQAGRPTELILG